MTASYTVYVVLYIFYARYVHMSYQMRTSNQTIKLGKFSVFVLWERSYVHIRWWCGLVGLIQAVGGPSRDQPSCGAVTTQQNHSMQACLLCHTSYELIYVWTLLKILSSELIYVWTLLKILSCEIIYVWTLLKNTVLWTYVCTYTVKNIVTLWETSIAARSSDDLEDPLGNAERVLEALRVKLSLFSSNIPFCHSPGCYHYPSGEFIKILLSTLMNTLQSVYEKRTAKRRIVRKRKKPDRLSIVSRQRPGVFLAFQKLSKQQQILNHQRFFVR
jgi:hypothetical protein